MPITNSSPHRQFSSKVIKDLVIYFFLSLCCFVNFVWLTSLLLRAGDVETHPGPYQPKFPCFICNKAAKWKQKCLQCTMCLGWYHTSCLDMSDSLHAIHAANISLEWTCYQGCGMPQFWNLDSSIFNSSPNVDIPTSPTPQNPPPRTPDPSPSASTRPSATSTPVARPDLSDIETSASSIDDTSGRSFSIGPAKKRDEITIVVANCDGVTGKKATIENMLTSLQPDIFLAVESKLDDSVYDAEFLPPTYRDSPPARKDRKRGGGGVFIAVREGIIAEQLTEFDSECEIAWTKIQLECKNFLIVGVYYRPPDSSIASLQELNTSISKIRTKYPRAKIFLGGDFNLPGINWETYSHTPLKPKKADCEYLLQTAADFHLDQLNTNPTRKQNILELLFTSCPETVLHCETGPGISDHDHILITRVKLRVSQNKKQPRTIHLFQQSCLEESQGIHQSNR